jgi:DNA-binding CsgD family transcriptional regulator
MTRVLKLTPREKEIAVMIERGARRKEIACSLGIATRTVDSFLVRIKLKTGHRIVKAA